MADYFPSRFRLCHPQIELIERECRVGSVGGGRNIHDHLSYRVREFGVSSVQATSGCAWKETLRMEMNDRPGGSEK